jgi:hypothetical protein
MKLLSRMLSSHNGFLGEGHDTDMLSRRAAMEALSDCLLPHVKTSLQARAASELTQAAAILQALTQLLQHMLRCVLACCLLCLVRPRQAALVLAEQHMPRAIACTTQCTLSRSFRVAGHALVPNSNHLGAYCEVSIRVCTLHIPTRLTLAGARLCAW